MKSVLKPLVMKEVICVKIGLLVLDLYLLWSTFFPLDAQVDA